MWDSHLDQNCMTPYDITCGEAWGQVAELVGSSLPPSSMLVLHYFLVSFLLFFQTSLSQTTECTYFCPPEDELGQTLLKQPLAIPYQSHYSIFECVYVQVCLMHLLFWGLTRRPTESIMFVPPPCSRTGTGFDRASQRGYYQLDKKVTATQSSIYYCA